MPSGVWVRLPLAAHIGYKMIKFLLTPCLLISSTVIAYIDVNYIPLFTLIYSIFIILGDLVLPRDYNIYDDKNKRLFNFFVILPLPLLLI